jgi:glycosyltransferase involved in cell wall biosynthesis
MPTASVIMPCFNHERFIADSVESVLAQTQPDLELIIVDDGSVDDSWKIICGLAAADARIKPIRHERNGGASRSRNDGIRAATGEFIGFCDADDIWEPEKLKSQIALLQSSPDHAVTYSDAAIIDETGHATGKDFSGLFPVPARPSGWLFPELVRKNFINIQTVLMRRDCVQRAGYFDEDIKWIEDWWYWVRLSRRFRFVYSGERLARYRVHSRSTNVVQKRGYSVNRVKVFGKMLREFTDLSRAARAEVLFNMAAELQGLGKHRAAGRLLVSATRLSLTDLRAMPTLAKALRRILLRPSRTCPPPASSIAASAAL